MIRFHVTPTSISWWGKTYLTNEMQCDGEQSMTTSVNAAIGVAQGFDNGDTYYDGHSYPPQETGGYPGGQGSEARADISGYNSDGTPIYDGYYSAIAEIVSFKFYVPYIWDGIGRTLTYLAAASPAVDFWTDLPADYDSTVCPAIANPTDFVPVAIGTLLWALPALDDFVWNIYQTKSQGAGDDQFVTDTSDTYNSGFIATPCASSDVAYGQGLVGQGVIIDWSFT